MGMKMMKWLNKGSDVQRMLSLVFSPTWIKQCWACEALAQPTRYAVDGRRVYAVEVLLGNEMRATNDAVVEMRSAG